MESIAPSLLWSGAFGGGKSRLLCEKVLFLAERYPKNRLGVFRKTYTSLRETTMATFFDEVCPSDHVATWNKSEHRLTLKNGSVVLFEGLDKSSRIASMNLGGAGIDQCEEITEDDWRMVEGRLRHQAPSVRQVVGACNPAAPDHWLYKLFFETKPEGHEVYHANTLDNPYLPEDYKDRLKLFRGIYYDRYVLGKWVGMSGQVWPVWDPQVHVVEPFEVPKDWRRFRVVDFGYTNPLVVQWWALSPDKPEGGQPANSLFRYREIYQTHLLVAEAAKLISRFSEGEDIEATIADHDAEDLATLENGLGTVVQRAIKDVSPGVQAVHRHLDPSQKGGPRLFLFKDALVSTDLALEAERKPTCTEQEIASYVWPKSTSGKAIREVPIKDHDHGCDAMRYMVLWMEEGAGHVGIWA